ncbi:HipA domain-containing protein [Variovorax sp. EBFNA2]|uniref:HipA domain-containing protein n=1 Tax=Variovorax sp. EBFNA2 TaxID=3342097 RepID=UPI0029C0E61A|nr:HipA domain-containing protein [Variovorax boronicumulans]WPG41013.1 HipA domain-containing protein [Variovorax boronicumulans]
MCSWSTVSTLRQTDLGSDIAALMNLRVRDIQSDRKYQGSYQRIAELMQYLQLPSKNLERFFEQVAFSIMVRNGDAHLKNFGLLYTSSADCRLAPMFDVVTTALYRYTARGERSICSLGCICRGISAKIVRARGGIASTRVCLSSSPGTSRITLMWPGFE